MTEELQGGETLDRMVKYDDVCQLYLILIEHNIAFFLLKKKCHAYYDLKNSSVVLLPFI